VRELRHQDRSVLGGVEAGKEVTIRNRGKVIARFVPEKPQSKQVDGAQSAALRMKRKSLPVLTAWVAKSLRADSQGSF
jgi:antitoxin (DNA-binding transcriptional repressor) of toxin-antitoxin stability system